MNGKQLTSLLKIRRGELVIEASQLRDSLKILTSTISPEALGILNRRGSTVVVPDAIPPSYQGTVAAIKSNIDTIENFHIKSIDDRLANTKDDDKDVKFSTQEVMSWDLCSNKEFKSIL